jgi:hypothetical protein
MRVESHLTHVFILENIFIKPGINFFTPEEVERLQSNPISRMRFDSGQIVVHKDPKNLRESNDALDYPEKVLLKDIPKILDVKVLDKIKAMDNRPAILKAVDKQIAILREGGPRKKEAKAQ